MAVLVLGLLLARRSGAAGGRPRAGWARPGMCWPNRPRRVTALSSATNVAYIGVVELECGMPGEFSDPLPAPDPDPEAPPPDLGEIDLALELVRSGDTVSGYVDLEFTLVFTQRHEVNSTWYGPGVEGTFDGTNLALTSERVSLEMAGKQLMRQFRLIGAAVPGQEGTLSGEYRETVWGYGPQPLTVVGTFTLKEAQSEPGAQRQLWRRLGSGLPPLKVAFEDLSSGDPTSWAWDFGDGGTSTEQNPEHTYTDPGTYAVTLTVSNAISSDTLSVPDRIIVTLAEVYLPVVLRGTSTR